MFMMTEIANQMMTEVATLATVHQEILDLQRKYPNPENDRVLQGALGVELQNLHIRLLSSKVSIDTLREELSKVDLSNVPDELQVFYPQLVNQSGLLMENVKITLQQLQEVLSTLAVYTSLTEKDFDSPYKNTVH